MRLFVCLSVCLFKWILCIFKSTSRWAWTGGATTATTAIAAAGARRAFLVLFRTLFLALLRRRFLRFFTLFTLFRGIFLFSTWTTFRRWATISVAPWLFLIVCGRVSFGGLFISLSVDWRRSTISASGSRPSCIALATISIAFLSSWTRRSLWSWTRRSLLSWTWTAQARLPLSRTGRALWTRSGTSRTLLSLYGTARTLSRTNWASWSRSMSAWFIRRSPSITWLWWKASRAIGVPIVPSWGCATSTLIVPSRSVVGLPISFSISILIVSAFRRLFVVGEIQSIVFAAVFDDQTASFAAPLHLGHGLREIDVNASIVDEYIVHFEIGRLTRFTVLKLDERILQRIAARSIANHFAALHLAETTEDNFQVIVSRHRIQFAHKQNIFGRCNIGIGQIADNFQNRCSRLCLTIGQHFIDFGFTFALCVVNVGIGSNATAAQTFHRRWRRTTWCTKAPRIFEWIFQHDRVCDANILIWSMVGIANGFVQFPQYVQSFDHLTNHTVHAIQWRLIRVQREEELWPDQIVAQTNHWQ